MPAYMVAWRSGGNGKAKMGLWASAQACVKLSAFLTVRQKINAARTIYVFVNLE
jgi:hypothetical protein